MKTLIVAVLFAALSAVALTEARPIPEGDKPYIPSRLEWLAVDLNSSLHVPITEQTGYDMSIIPIVGKDTILIFVRYSPSVNREAMNLGIDAARKVVAIMSKAYGFSSWLKVRERIELDNGEVDER